MSFPRLVIPERSSAAGGRTLIIAEVGMAHDGSLGTAHAFIDAVATTGADAVKFQTHIASAESTPQEKFRVALSRQDATRTDYWTRTGFTLDQWMDLAHHSRERGLLFLSSPFSFEAVDWLERAGVAAWKIASGETSNLPMLARIASTGLPVLLSSGMSSYAELDAAVSTIKQAGAPLALFQCTTAYPCRPEQIGLNVLSEMRARYNCAVGLSDHSGVIYAGLAAATLGVEMIEVHVTMSRAMFGPDVAASLTIDEFKSLVEGVRFIEATMANPVHKDTAAEALAPMRALFSKSVVALRGMQAGHIIGATDIGVKKPGIGIPAAKLGEVVGRKLARDVAADDFLRDGDLV